MHKQVQEIAKFDALASDWWQPNGAFAMLHKMNEARHNFVEQKTHLNNQRILDMGCGGGIFSERLAKSEAQVVGIDGSEHAIATAKQHANEQCLSIEYHCQLSDQYVQQCPESFDIVTCMELLEHVDDPQAIISDGVRALKPGGWFFLSTIDRSIKTWCEAIILAEHVLKLLPIGTHYYANFIRPSELAIACEIAGLQVCSIKGMQFKPLQGCFQLTHTLQSNYIMACRKYD